MTSPIGSTAPAAYATGIIPSESSRRKRRLCVIWKSIPYRDPGFLKKIDKRRRQGNP